jgi:hypothetical protein
MTSMVLLRMSPSWPLSKSRLIQHTLLATKLGMPWWASHAAGLFFLGLLGLLDLTIDPKFHQIKSSQIHITSKNNTNSTKSIYIWIKFRQTSRSGQLAPGNSVWNNEKISYRTSCHQKKITTKGKTMDNVLFTDMTGLKGPFQIMPIKQYRIYGKIGSGGEVPQSAKG